MALDFSTAEKAAKQATFTSSPSQPLALEEKPIFVQSASIFKMFNFSTNGLESTFHIFVNSASLLPQFSNGDIKIYHPQGIDFEDPDYPSLMAMKENKPIDVLVYLHAVKTNQFTENREMFDFNPSENTDQKTFVKNITILVFAYLLYMTRGSLPKTTGSSSQNVLPKLLKDNIDDASLLVESDFAMAAASFNLEKLDSKFFLLIDKSNMPDQIVNRIRKGSAGSRSLKFFKMVLDRPGLTTDGFNAQELGILKVLQNKVGLSQSYLSLHPANQVVQAQVDRFYPSVLSLGARLIGEKNWPSFVAEICKIPTFDKDNVLKGLSIRDNIVYLQNAKFEHGFKSIKPEILDGLFGEPY
jgi:hypothetical protein